MAEVYLVGHISVKEADKWQTYRSQVPATLAPWQAELLFRGEKMAMLAGEHAYDDIVAIRFPTDAALQGWHASPAYQALIPLRKEAAEVVLIAYRSV
ncbi:MAG TPA: DUF1330 domain-containing protein [Accumulibacter sp.]|jgi:uncharacterized protein (DUF1330 family)|nr:DUF1330 domain-containing protein [Accumulibacter sp.]